MGTNPLIIFTEMNVFNDIHRKCVVANIILWGNALGLLKLC